MIRAIVVAAVTVVSASGCAAHSQYKWGSYEQNLYSYYKSPNAEPELVAALEEATGDLDEGQRVAPGLFAELGMLYMNAGRNAEARRCFDQELHYWPESSVMIAALTRGLAPEQARPQAPPPSPPLTSQPQPHVPDSAVMQQPHPHAPPPPIGMQPGPHAPPPPPSHAETAP
jgi:hypothetical protein